MGPHQKGSGKHEKRGNASRKAFPLLYVHSPLKNELLGVQFDDVGFVDFVLVGEFVSLGETGEGCSPVVDMFPDFCPLQNRRDKEKCDATTPK